MAEQHTSQRDFPAYTDLPLDYIRVVRILPGAGESDIHCHISLVSLKKQPDYIALSYAWGSPEKEGSSNANARTTRKRKERGKTRTIYLNGHPLGPIRKNLWRFLNQARELASTLTDLQSDYWIDAICIDQSHQEERKQQVGLMPRIYETARKVLIWLGPTYDNSNVSLRELTRPILYWRAKKNVFSVWTKPAGAAISSLCGRPYWRRLWIFQKIMLARQIDIMCGDEITPWGPFRDFLVELSTLTPPPRIQDAIEYQNVRNSPAMAIVKQTAKRPLDATERLGRTLWNLMSATEGLHCAEPRDRVYALLGVAQAGHTNIIADYSMSITTLLNLVLKKQHEVEPPCNLEEVASQCRYLERLLHIEAHSLVTLEGLSELEDRLHCPGFLHSPVFNLNLPQNYTTLGWASLYGHDAVKRLLFDPAPAEFGFDEWRLSNMLFKSAQDGNEALLSELLIWHNQYIPGSVDYDDINTPLQWAAENGHKMMTSFLLESPEINIDSVSRYPVSGYLIERLKSPLLLAAANGHDAIVKMLMHRADLNRRDRDGRTPLWAAAASGDDAIVNLLLDTGKVNIDSFDYEGLTPLSGAVLYGRDSTVKLLLDRGANLQLLRFKIRCQEDREND